MRTTLDAGAIEPHVTEVKFAIKQVAGEEVVVMREDFRESYSMYPGDLNVPLGRSKQFRYGGVGCSIRFDVNYRQYHSLAGYICVLLLQAFKTSSLVCIFSPFSNTSIISSLIKCSVAKLCNLML